MASITIKWKEKKKCETPETLPRAVCLHNQAGRCRRQKHYREPGGDSEISKDSLLDEFIMHAVDS